MHDPEETYQEDSESSKNGTRCKPKLDSPALQVALGSDSKGEPYGKKPWKYYSAIGDLLINTRPAIAFAVSQVARFSSNPKMSHKTKIKTILHYLVCTKEKGMIVNLTGDLNIECYYLDAYFGGLYYKREPDANPESAKLRTRFIKQLVVFSIL
jgi:hypothetical protein